MALDTTNMVSVSKPLLQGGPETRRPPTQSLHRNGAAVTVTAVSFGQSAVIRGSEAHGGDSHINLREFKRADKHSDEHTSGCTVRYM